MNRLALAFGIAFALALAALPAPARAQLDMQIHIGLPVAPPLVVVQPGVQVVENYDEEIFVVGGWYWCRRGDYWYRARSPRAAFVYVEPVYVPTRLAYLPPPGHYRHWDRRRLHDERRWWREHEHDRRRAWHEHDTRRAAWDRDHRGPPGHAGRGPGPTHGHAPLVAPAPDRGPRPVLSRPPERGHSSVLAPSSSDRGHSSVLAPSSSDRGHSSVVSRPAERGHSSVAAPSSSRHGERHGDHDRR